MSKLEEIVDIAQQMVGMTEADYELLRSVSDQTVRWAQPVAKSFYDHVYKIEESTKLMEGQDRKEREEFLEGWYAHVVSCDHRKTFWKETWIVGLVHVIRNIGNAYMLGMATQVSLIFRKASLETFGLEKGTEVSDSFQRLMGMISIVIAEGYVDGLLEGMKAVGLNVPLMERMRTVEVGRALAKLREEVAAES